MNPARSKIRADMARHRNLFDLAEDDLGRDLLKAATDGVQNNIAAEESPDGVRWADLSQAYDEWKRLQYSGNPMALLHGEMINPRQAAD